MTDELVKRLDDLDPILETEFDTQIAIQRNPYGATKAIEKSLYLLRDQADRIETLTQEVKDLKKLVFAAYCEGFNDGKDGGWIVGPSNQPWKASDAHRMLKTMGAKP